MTKRSRKIALGGLDVDSLPIEVSTDGFIQIRIPVEAFDVGAWASYGLGPTRRDCRVEVRGCRAKFETEAPEVAAEDGEDKELWAAMLQEAIDERRRALLAEAEDEAAYQAWEARLRNVQRRWASHRQRMAVRSIDRFLKADPQNAAMVILSLQNEIDELRALI